MRPTRRRLLHALLVGTLLGRAAGPVAAGGGSAGAAPGPGPASASEAAASAASERVTELPAPGDPAWEPFEFPGIEHKTRYTPEPRDGRDRAAVRAESRCSASALALALPGLDLRETPWLRWSWRVEQGPGVSDERAKAGDDFAARVYVMFRFDPETASFGQRMRHRVAAALYGGEPPGDAVNFVWTSRVAPGTRWTSPYTDQSKMLALASGDSGGWRSEEIDVAAEYRALFGRPPPPVLGVAIMSDSDNTCRSAIAHFADFAIAALPARAAADETDRRVAP